MAKRRKTLCACGNQLRQSGQNNCLACHAEYSRNWRADNGGSQSMTVEQRKRSNARAYLHVYIKRGKIIKQPCEICQNPNVKSHHEDYDKPLQVRWLCPGHHQEVTNGERILLTR